MPPTGFESAFPASERPQTHALDRAASGIDIGYNATNEMAIPWGSILLKTIVAAQRFRSNFVIMEHDCS